MRSTFGLSALWDKAKRLQQLLADDILTLLGSPKRMRRDLRLRARHNAASAVTLPAKFCHSLGVPMVLSILEFLSNRSQELPPVTAPMSVEPIVADLVRLLGAVARAQRKKTVSEATEWLAYIKGRAWYCVSTP